MNEENDENISNSLGEETKRDLAPITPVIYTALEIAQSIVPECIDSLERYGQEGGHSEKIKKWLYPSLMRAIVQTLLNSKNLKTKRLLEHDNGSFQNADWERIILSNNGLAGEYADRKYRILKALKYDDINKKLPPPGNSSVKKSFYCQRHLQQYMMPLFSPAEISTIQKHNVIYLWDNPAKDSIILYLSCPKWGDGSRAEAYFIEPIEHPVLSVKPAIEIGEIVQEIGLEKLKQDINILDGGDRDEQGEPTQVDLWRQNRTGP